MGAETLHCGIFRTRSPSLLYVFPPLGVHDYPLMKFFPLGRSRLYTPRRDVPLVEMLMQICLRAFLGGPTGAETLHYGIFPTQSPLLYCGDVPLLRAPICSCNTPILQIRRRYGDVHTQGENTLKYVR